LDEIRYPEGGWQAFWERFSQTLDVRLAQQVQDARRHADGVEIVTQTATHKVDALLLAAPLDELPNADMLTEDERRIVAGVTWDQYVVTMSSVKQWADAPPSMAFEKAISPGAEAGMLLGVRVIGKKPSRRSTTQLVLFGQYGGGLSPKDLADRATRDFEACGGAVDYIALQKIWKYNPAYRPDAIRDGLLATMRDIQGVNRTWYTGATFSFESVANIVAFNKKLVPRIVEGIGA